jgi:hypothetical protein
METDSYVLDINRLKTLAKDVKSIDLLDPSSATVLVMGEILQLCKRLPDLELVDFSSKTFNIDNIEADA